MALTKNDIIKRLHSQTGIARKEASHLLETLLEIMKREMVGGKDVMISGFGKFNVNEKRARRGRNPATGESMTLEARKVVTFTCSNVLRKKINGEE